MGVNAVNRKLTETKFVKIISNIFTISLAPWNSENTKKTKRIVYVKARIQISANNWKRNKFLGQFILKSN